jgi:tripartite ATP-independent transporter DctP family solute receptor
MKKLLVLLIIASMVLTFAACGQSNKAVDQNKEYVMRIGTPTTNDPQVYEMEQFKKILDQKTGGKIKVELYPSGQLGSNSQMLQGLQAGTIQALLEPTAFLGGFSSVLNVVDLPYFFKDVWSATELLNGSAGDPLRAYLEKKGIVTASFYPYGDRVTLTVSKIEKKEDFSGKKIRVMGAKVLQDQFNAWGASGIPMDVPELYTALQQKTLDGLESAAQFFQTGKYYEVAKFLLTEPKGAEVTIFMVNKAWLDSLPQDLRTAVYDAAKEVQPLATEYAKKTEGEARKIMADAGVEIVDASEEFRNQLIEASQVVHENFLKDNPDAKDIYDQLKKAIAAQ